MGFFDKLFGNSDQSNNSVSNKPKDDSMIEFQLRQQAGQSVMSWCIDASKVKGLPYICFFDWEVDMVEKAMNADDSLYGNIDVLLCINEYMSQNDNLAENNPIAQFNKNHAYYWTYEICRRAAAGSIYAQSAVYSNYFPIARHPEVQQWIFSILGDRGEEFGNNIKNRIDNNDPSAILAYAFFILFGDEANEELRNNMFFQAGQLGLSEGYHQFIFTLQNWNSSPEGFRVAQLAAECDDGKFAYDFQYRLGMAYWYGEGWVNTPDKELGLYWFNKAASNGDRAAVAMLDMLRKNGEIY